MKRNRSSVEQNVAAVKQHDLGTPAAAIARKLGIAEQTFYRWKKEHGGFGQPSGDAGRSTPHNCSAAARG